MKRLLALMLASALALSLAACGGGSEAGDNSTPSAGNGDKTSTDTPSNGNNAPNTDNNQEENSLTSVKWVDLYRGGSLVLNDDQTMALGDNSGTWSQDGSLLTLTYQAPGGNLERYADVIEKNGVTMIRTQREGKADGSVTNFAISEYYPEDKIADIKASVAKALGDTVSTDIIELTVEKASLAYYAAGASTRSDGTVANIEEACEPADGGFFKCNKGRVLVCLDFAIKNTDRDTLNTSDYIVSFSVNQNENSATVKGYDLNNPDGSYGLNLGYSPISLNGGDFEANNSGNIIIKPSDTYEIKVVGIAGFEAEDISAPFELVVGIKNSSGNTEQFIYNIG